MVVLVKEIDCGLIHTSYGSGEEVQDDLDLTDYEMNDLCENGYLINGGYVYEIEAY